MNTAIIIVHFGKLATTQECIKSILKYEKSYHSVVVVNNDQQQLVKSNFPSSPQLVIINNPRNVGFATAVNIGIKYALSHNADSILLINNDTILHKPIMKKLSEAFDEHSTIGIVGPAIEFFKKNKKLYDLGGYVNMTIGKTRHDNEKKIPFEVLQFPDYVSGCCMLIKESVIKKIGYFDERFFLYYEDVDFCLRAKKAGFAVAVDPSIILYHGLSKTAGKNSKIILYHQTRSALQFGKKYFGKRPQRVLHSTFIVMQSLLFIKNNPRTGWAALQAIIDVMRKR